MKLAFIFSFDRSSTGKIIAFIDCDLHHNLEIDVEVVRSASLEWIASLSVFFPTTEDDALESIIAPDTRISVVDLHV